MRASVYVCINLVEIYEGCTPMNPSFLLSLAKKKITLNKTILPKIKILI